VSDASAARILRRLPHGATGASRDAGCSHAAPGFAGCASVKPADRARTRRLRRVARRCRFAGEERISSLISHGRQAPPVPGGACFSKPQGIRPLLVGCRTETLLRVCSRAPGAPVRSRERRPSFGRTTDGVRGPGRCNLRRGRSRRIPAATARSRSSCALPELAAPNLQELSAQLSAFTPARSSTWQANRNPEEMRAHRFPSREWGAGIRQNSGQNERSASRLRRPRVAKHCSCRRGRTPRDDRLLPQRLRAARARGSEPARAVCSTQRFQTGPEFNLASKPQSGRDARSSLSEPRMGRRNSPEFRPE
jgi:hypothetical protein